MGLFSPLPRRLQIDAALVQGPLQDLVLLHSYLAMFSVQFVGFDSFCDDLARGLHAMFAQGLGDIVWQRRQRPAAGIA